MREQQLQDILGHMPAGIVTLQGPELRYGFVNEAMRVLLGGATPEGTPIADCPGTLPADLLTVLQQVYAAGRPYVAKAYQLPTVPAARRYFDLALEPVREGGGPVSGLLLFAVEVTAQEEARQRAHELALETRRLDARLRVLTETMPQITFTVDAAGHYEYVSPQWYYFTGQPPTADLRAIWPLLIHPDDRLRVLYQADAARAGGIGWSFEYRLRRRDGQYRWLLSRALPELHAPGEPVFWHGGLTEVHDQRELAEALRRGEAELRFLADSIPQLIWTATAEGLSDYYNQHTEEYSGLTGAELGPTGWISLLEPSEQAGAARQWVQCIASGDPYEGLFRLRRHDGQYCWHLIRARQLTDARGPRWFGACTDVHDQHQLRETLQTQYNELTRTNADLDNFVYTASHDLQQPIANIEGLLHALREHLPAAIQHAEPVQSLLTMMQGAIERFQRTIVELTDISRLQQAHTTPVEVVDLAALVENVRLDLAPQLAEAGAEFLVDLAACPVVSFAPKHLRSIVYNLVTNAVKYRAPARVPVVHLRSHSTATTVVLEVHDNGLGLDQIQQAKLFGMFVRLHDHVEGTGIGLYMVKKIITNAGGTITVQSQPGVGSTFVVSLPRVLLNH